MVSSPSPVSCIPSNCRMMFKIICLSLRELLGHEDIKLTLGTYSHFLPSMGDQIATAMETVLG